VNVIKRKNPSGKQMDYKNDNAIFFHITSLRWLKKYAKLELWLFFNQAVILKDYIYQVIVMRKRIFEIIEVSQLFRCHPAL
jgi:hypothetical protein